MATIDLEFSKSKVEGTNNTHRVRRVSGPAFVKADSGDTINFTRSGNDDSMGFEVTFTGDSPPGPITVPNGETSASIIAPKSKATLFWKYEVSFSNDSSLDQTVIPYDPIIIINPGMSSSLVQMLAIFAAGVGLTYLVLSFFPGLVG